MKKEKRIQTKTEKRLKSLMGQRLILVATLDPIPAAAATLAALGLFTDTEALVIVDCEEKHARELMERRVRDRVFELEEYMQREIWGPYDKG